MWKRYGRVGQATDGSIACWITKSTDIRSGNVILLLLYFNDGCTNAPQCYVYAQCLFCFSYGREPYNGSSPCTSQALYSYMERKWEVGGLPKSGNCAAVCHWVSSA